METQVVWLTDGQAAANRGDAQTSAELGQVRSKEFAASCKVLGVSLCELWDYQDGQLEFSDFSAAAGRLVAKMREFKPDVVLTFGSNGAVNTYPDHSMVSAFTSVAFHWRRRQNAFRSSAKFTMRSVSATSRRVSSWRAVPRPSLRRGASRWISARSWDGSMMPSANTSLRHR